MYTSRSFNDSMFLDAGKFIRDLFSFQENKTDLGHPRVLNKSPGFRVNSLGQYLQINTLKPICVHRLQELCGLLCKQGRN